MVAQTPVPQGAPVVRSAGELKKLMKRKEFDGNGANAVTSVVHPINAALEHVIIREEDGSRITCTPPRIT